MAGNPLEPVTNPPIQDPSPPGPEPRPVIDPVPAPPEPADPMPPVPGDPAPPPIKG